MSIVGRYVLCTHKQALMEHRDGLPVQHLGRYGFLPAAEHHMRYLGTYIKNMVVLDIKDRIVVAKLEQEMLEHDPLAPPIEMYQRYEEDQIIGWRKVHYDYHNTFGIAEQEENKGGSEEPGETD